MSSPVNGFRPPLQLKLDAALDWFILIRSKLTNLAM